MIWFLLACTEDKGDTASEMAMPYCEDTATEVALDEETDLGFAAQAVVDLAVTPSPWAETFTWERGGSTELTLTVGPAGTALYVESEAVYPDSGEVAAIGVECPNRVEVQAPVGFVTADGAFGESWDVVLSSVDGTTVTFGRELDPFGLTGSYDVLPDVGEPEYDELDLWVRGTFAAAGATGEVSGSASGEDECEDGETCSAWNSSFQVGTWGGEDE